MVERVWHALTSSGHASRIPGTLFFAYAVVAEVPGVAVDNDGEFTSPAGISR